MRLMKFFARKEAPADFRETISVEDLDHSFSLLQSTTAEVSTAAVEAAKVLQERLDDSVDRFYSTIDSIEDLILVKDGEGRWQTMNKFGQDLFGMHHGEYHMKTDAELSVMFPKFAETFEICVKTDRKAWDTRTASRSEEKVPFARSHRHFDVIKAPIFNDDGSRKELIIVGREITEILEKTKRERACFQALNSASDAIVIIDAEGKVFFCNDRFVEMFGFKSYQEVVDFNLPEVIPHIPQYDEMWATISSNKVWSVQCPHLCMDHSKQTNECPLSITNCVPSACPIRKMQLNVIPMMNGHPKPIYYICTFKVGDHK